MRGRRFIYVTCRTESDKMNERKLHLIRHKSKVCAHAMASMAREWIVPNLELPYQCGARNVRRTIRVR